MDWLKTKVISIFKKGKRKDCGNYRVIRLLNSTYKLYSGIINRRLAKISDGLLQEEKNGYRMGRSCIDSVFILNQIIEKRREFNLETHIAFIQSFP